MIERIVVFGDSYTYGHGCQDRVFYIDPDTKQVVGQRTPDNFPSEYCWASLLSKEYNIPVINLARCGHSNPAMFRDLMNFGTKDNHSKLKTLVLFAGTSPDRLEASGNRGELHSWVLSHNWDPAWQGKMDPHLEQYFLAKKMYIMHLYQDEIGRNIGLMSLLAAKQYCELRGFSFEFSMPMYWYDPDIIKHLQNDTGIIKHQFQDIQSYDYSGTNNDWANKNIYKCVDNHTNEKGHEVYYQNIIRPIMDKYK